MVHFIKMQASVYCKKHNPVILCCHQNAINSCFKQLIPVQDDKI